MDWENPKELVVISFLKKHQAAAVVQRDEVETTIVELMAEGACNIRIHECEVKHSTTPEIKVHW